MTEEQISTYADKLITLLKKHHALLDESMVRSNRIKRNLQKFSEQIDKDRQKIGEIRDNIDKALDTLKEMEQDRPSFPF